MPKFHSWAEFTAIVLTWTFAGAGMTVTLIGVIMKTQGAVDIGNEWIKNAMMIGFGTPVGEVTIQTLRAFRQEDDQSSLQ